MSQASAATRWNLDALESMYERWRKDPGSVDASWQFFFQGFDLGLSRPPQKGPAATGVSADARLQIGIARLTYAYRDVGHFLAHLDPLTEPRASHPLLDLPQWGFTEA